MTGQFAINSGIRIYFEVHGDGPPLLLHHGFASSSAAWREFGYIAALAQTHRVIVMDARGHGRSDKPHDEAAYAVDFRTGDVAAVLDASDVEQVDYWGYSMGGWTGFAFIERYPHRVRGFVNGAASADSPRRVAARIRAWAEALRSADPERIGSTLGAPHGFTSQLVQRNDLIALAAAQMGLLSWNGVDVSGFAVPSLHYAGDRDPMLATTQATARQMPEARFVSLPGLNHLTAFGQSDRVLPIVEQFLNAARQSR